MENKRKIFFVEDDQNLGFMVCEYLESEGFDLFHYTDGDTALKAIKELDFDLAILDIMLPNVDGYALAKNIKNEFPSCPIIFLTAKSEPDDRLKGFQNGGDEYLTKPFLSEELKLRIEYHLQRAQSPDEDELLRKYIRIGKYRLYPRTSILKYSDEEILLTNKEFDLLVLLYEHRKEYLTREYAFREVWHKKFDPNSRILDVYIGKIRKHFKKDKSIHIRSVHGKGYRLEF